jgi:selenocysteine-specific elongation factor
VKRDPLALCGYPALRKMRYVVVVTAGHIDHGKSALVKALTGIDPDRLKEEKLRGITIDLGFAHLNLGDLQVGFVDVPGHERFVRNMLAGVGGIDFVLLVVAADESIMPQTREHFDICRLLGIQAGIVVITKVDMAEPDLVELVREEVRETVRGSFLEAAEIVAVSSKTGEGIKDLISAIRQLALAIPQRSSTLMLRLPIDRAFSIRGFGTVVTGTLTSGEIRREEEVELIPGGIKARVRGIQVHGANSDRAVAGQRTAVNLQGVELSQVQRGMVLTVPYSFRPSQLLDARLELLPDARPLRSLVKVRFHQGTAEILAKVALIGQDTLAPGRSAYAQLRLDSPLLALHGDAFIIRQFSPAVTIGGGRVLNPAPAKHKTTDKQALEAMRSLATGLLAEKIPVLIMTHVRPAMDLVELNSLLGLPEAELRGVCSEVAAAGKCVMIPAPLPILVLPQVIDALGTETIKRVTEFHQQNPLLKGIQREELRKRVFGDMPLEVFRFCLERLVERRKISLQEEMVSLYGREVQLSEQGKQIKERIEALFLQSGYQPPSLSELPAALPAQAEEVRKIYFWMLKEKILIKVSDDLAYHRSTLEQMRGKIRACFAPGSKFGVAEFKELFGLSRKHAIPLLEFLDRERFTRRQGNDRLLL